MIQVYGRYRISLIEHDGTGMEALTAVTQENIKKYDKLIGDRSMFTIESCLKRSENRAWRPRKNTE